MLYVFNFIVLLFNRIAFSLYTAMTFNVGNKYDKYKIKMKI